MARVKSKRAGSKSEARTEAARDWDAIRRRYVTGAESTREVAAATGVSYSTVAKRSASEHWDAERNAWRAKAHERATAAAIERRVRSEAEIDGDAHEGALAVVRKALDLLDAQDDPAKIKAVVEALEKAHRLARITARLPAEPVTSVAQQEVSVLVRYRDEDGMVREERADGRDAAEAPRGGSDGSQADAQPSEVPRSA
jgi:hypothetical protein